MFVLDKGVRGGGGGGSVLERCVEMSVLEYTEASVLECCLY